MPIYEYQCKNCDHQFETIRKISDKTLRKCPECGKLKLIKLMSAVAFRLKGDGWYETDFKSGDKKNVAGDRDDSAAKSSETSDSSKKADKSAGSEGKSEAKGEAKKESVTKKETGTKKEAGAKKADGAGKSAGNKSSK